MFTAHLFFLDGFNPRRVLTDNFFSSKYQMDTANTFPRKLVGKYPRIWFTASEYAQYMLCYQGDLL